MLKLYSRELSSYEEQCKFFESAMKDRNISLDFTHSGLYNAYQDKEAQDAFIFFIYGVFSVLNSY